MSDIYRKSQIPIPKPSVQLERTVPLQPEEYILPGYPVLAKMARIDGSISFTFSIDPDGGATDVVRQTGNPLLFAGVPDVVKGWKFSKARAGQKIDDVFPFNFRRPSRQETA